MSRSRRRATPGRRSRPPGSQSRQRASSVERRRESKPLTRAGDAAAARVAPPQASPSPNPRVGPELSEKGVAQGGDTTQPMFSYGVARLSSFGWAFFGRVGNQLIQVAGTIILGRLIAPSQFGILAAATVVIALGQIFTDLGLGPAIVHRRVLDESFLRTAFWVNALSGVALTLVAAALGWPLAHWYHFRALIWVLPLEGLAFTVSVSTVGLALMERQFRFRAIGQADLISVLCGQGISILVALFVTRSVFALAIAPMVTAAVLSVIVMFISGWRPAPRIQLSRPDLRELKGFASYLSIFNLASFSARNSDDFLVGRYVSAANLGFYSRSYALMLLPISQVTQALSRALLPTFARVKEDTRELQRLYSLSVLAAACIGFPAAVIGYAVAPSGLPFLLGPEWKPLVQLFQIFSISIPFQVLGVVHGSLYTATGNVRRLLYSGLFTSGLLVIAFAIAARYGTRVVAETFTVHAALTLPLVVVPITKKLGLRFREAVPRLLLLFGGGGLLFIALYLVPDLAGAKSASASRLAIQVVILTAVGAEGLALVRHHGTAKLVRMAQVPSTRRRIA